MSAQTWMDADQDFIKIWQGNVCTQSQVREQVPDNWVRLGGWGEI